MTIRKSNQGGNTMKYLTMSYDDDDGDDDGDYGDDE